MFRAKPTDADGRFQIELTQSPEYTFMVEQRTLPEDARTFDYPTLTWQEITEGEEVTLFLNYSGLVWGEVVDEAGGPMEGITVRLGGTGLSRAARGVTAISDANGIFELNVPIGNVGQTQEEAESEAPAMYVYATQRNSENPATGFSPAALNAEEMVRLIMYADTEVVARVTANGEPLTSVQVSARYSLPELAWMGGNGGGRGGRTISSENGVFSLGKFPRGVSTLTIRQPRAREGERVRINEDAGTLLDIVVDLSGEEFAPVARGEGDGREGRPDWEGRGPGGGGPPGGGPRGGPGGGGPPPGDRM
jgi:hypothetical protein